MLNGDILTVAASSRNWTDSVLSGARDIGASGERCKEDKGYEREGLAGHVNLGDERGNPNGTPPHTR